MGSLILALALCGSAEAAGAGVGRYPKVEAIPAAWRGEMEAFGRMLEAEMKKAPYERASVRVDFREVAEALFQDYPGVPAGLQRNLRMGVAGASDDFSKDFWTPWNDGVVTFKGVVLFEGKPAVRLRVVQPKAGTVLFYELVLARGKEAESIRVTEMYNQTSGVASARLLREDLVAVLAKAVVGDRPPEGERQLKAGALMESFHALCDEGKFRDAAELFLTFPDSVQATPHYAIACAKAAQKSGDDALFRRVAAKVAAVLKNGQGMLMLAQLHEAQGNYEEAVACLDAFMPQVGADAALVAKKAHLLQRKGDTAAAVTLLKEAITLEPESVFVHTTGLDVLAAARDNAGIRDSLMVLEKAGALDVKEVVRTDARWTEFKASPEGAGWR